MLRFSPRMEARIFRSALSTAAPEPDRTSSHAPQYATSSPPNSDLKTPIPIHGWLGRARGGGTPHKSKSLHPASAAEEIADHHARSLPMSPLRRPLRPAKRL